MKQKYSRNVSTLTLSALLLAASYGLGVAGSLTGSEGDKRFPPYLPRNSKDPCTKAYKAYVAAGGHSAYATTPYARIMSSYIICGGHLNAPSQKAAEELAMKSCLATRTHYKVTTGGACEIAASK
ncbi:hypothetical protein NKI51_21710 [Mesorhizobium australicum]|uniref:hypothetical protein n=1 Tax=Mesorhizobium TaxID=68287 RepID=UPI0003CF8153|nr:MULTISPECIES: hypothetical protein [unclassified Mesorhizobium]ESY81987.1 hypothetical protein X739_27125 [Mesorhizobium sp. LNHC220B00]ESY94548.1 hypothetical protein X741_11925 [Mesorhizobium sp. LNHC229A00]